MSTKTIAMLMGGRWTEARVYNRLAEIDGQVAPSLPDLPLQHRVDEDLPEDPPAREPLTVAQFVSSLPRKPDAIERLKISPWTASQVSYLTAPAPAAPGCLFAQATSGSKSHALLGVFAATRIAGPDLILKVAPAEEVADAREAPDQSPPGADAATDTGSADAASPAGALHAAPAQADSDQAPEAADREDEVAPAPNPLAVEAHAFVPVHRARARKAPATVAAAVSNVLVAPPPPRARPSSQTAVRLKPLTDKVIGFAARFVRAGWDLDEVAGLFDVSPEALEKVLA